VPRDLDPTAIHDFLSFDYVPARARSSGDPAAAAGARRHGRARGLRLWRYWRAQPRVAARGDARAR